MADHVSKPAPAGATESTSLLRLNADKGEWAQLSKVDERGYGDATISHYRMGNGLQIIVWPDRTAPVFAYQSWFGVGSRHEKVGRTGIAHLFEHLMFKATENQPEGRFDQIMEAHGAETNAATWVDWTYYRAKLPKGNVGLVVGLEADRMAHLILDAGQLESEREVVKNERLGRVDNDPEGKLYETLYALAYDVHPYRWPTIGWMEDIEAITLEDCLAFYRTYYAPNNATLTVVGDVDLEALLAEVQEGYGHLAPQEIPAPDPVVEPPQLAEKRKVLELPVSASKVVSAWHAPAMGTEMHVALTILSEILTVGESSQLYKHLVTELELASEIWGWTSGWSEPGLFELGMNLRPGVSVEEAEEVFLADLEHVRTHGVTERQVKKAQNGLEAMFLRGIADTGSRARGLGNAHLSHGNFKAFFEEPERLRHVTPADVQKAAQAVLTRENRTVVVVLPQGAADD